MKTRIRAVSLILIGGLALSACSQDADPPEAPPTTSEPPATSEAATTAEPTTTADDVEQTTTEPELSPAEQDEADVAETLHLYVQALDDAFNGEVSIEEIYPYSKGTAREQWVTQVMADEAQGITSTGLTELELLEVSIDGDSAEVVACADVSDVEVLDEDGESIVPEDRLDRAVQDFVLERDSSAEFGWYVVEDMNRNEPCDR